MGGTRLANTSDPVKVGDILWVKTYGSWWPAQVYDENMLSAKNKPKKKLAGEVLVRLYGNYSYLYWHPDRYRTEFLNILEQHNGSYKEMFEKFLDQEVSHVRSDQSKRKTSELREKARDEAPKDKKLKQTGENKHQEVGRLGSGNLGKLSNITACVSRTRKARGSSGEVDDASTVQKQVNRKNLFSEGTRDKATKNEIAKPIEVEAGYTANNGVSATYILNKSPDLSLRRTKVMQSLGLVAPSDSPFRRSGVF